MTSPSDPWSARPDSPDAPTERVDAPGRPGEPPAAPPHTAHLHTSEYTAAYGSGGNPAEPYQYFDQQPGPNATRELPPYANQPHDGQWGDGQWGQGQQWGAPDQQPHAQQWGGGQWGGQPYGGPPGPVGPTGLLVEPPRRRRTGVWIALAVIVFLVVVVGGVAAGLLLAGNNSPSSSASGSSVRPTPGALIPGAPDSSDPAQPNVPQFPGLGGMDDIGATMGTISANDGSTLTVNSVLGKTVIVHTDDKTQVIALGSGKVADLHNGDMVVVQGGKSADGSIVAKVIISTQLPGR